MFSGLATWLPWLALGPMIFGLCRAFPFEGRHWVRSFLVHLPASFVFGLLWSTFRWSFSYLSWVDEKPLVFSKVAMSHLYLWFLSYWVLVGVHEAWHNYQRFKQGELARRSSKRAWPTPSSRSSRASSIRTSSSTRCTPSRR